MLQSTDPKRLSKKKGPKGDAWISLGRGKRTDLLDRFGESEKHGKLG